MLLALVSVESPVLQVLSYAPLLCQQRSRLRLLKSEEFRPGGVPDTFQSYVWKRTGWEFWRDKLLLVRDSPGQLLLAVGAWVALRPYSELSAPSQHCLFESVCVHPR